jgi:DMSO/TMAO reductase YedYZ molybdopterin-dependent catalytic subunit
MEGVPHKEADEIYNELRLEIRQSDWIDLSWDKKGENMLKRYGYILGVIIISFASLFSACSKAPIASTATTPTGSPAPNGEVEATEFQGQKLTPISDQRNNALAGTQHINRDTYVLTVDGLVDKPLSLSYADLLAMPQVSQLNTLNCVEGWLFVAKWTGPRLSDIFRQAGIQPDAKIAIFYTTDVTDGYSSLDVSYIQTQDIIIALKINDLTLPDDRGFPFQVVAQSKFGYKWSKWVTRIELSSDTSFRGYWEGAGYNNQGDVGGPTFGN